MILGGRQADGRSAPRPRPRRRWWLVLPIVLLLAGLVLWSVACDSGDVETSTSVTSEPGDGRSGDVQGAVGEAVKVDKVIITVRILDATFNPVTPSQRVSEASPTAPGGDESFYQAFLRIENRDSSPIRVDPEDFACAVGDAVVGIDPTWSGPSARTLLKGSSLDLLVTFKGKAGYQPVLLYSPSWYDGTIRFEAGVVTTTTT